MPRSSSGAAGADACAASPTAQAVGQALDALSGTLAQPGEIVGRLKLSVPRVAAAYVVTPVLPKFLEQHPRVEVETVFEERLVDLITEGYDAGVRLTEAIERDMVQVRLTTAFRFVVVGAPEYFAKHGTPRTPEELLRHDCITPRSQTTGELIPWDLERGRRSWRIPPRGRVVTNDMEARLALCAAAVGLAYVPEPILRTSAHARRLRVVLADFAATVPGFFLYFPKRAQQGLALRAFVDAAKQHAKRSY